MTSTDTMGEGHVWFVDVPAIGRNDVLFPENVVYLLGFMVLMLGMTR